MKPSLSNLPAFPSKSSVPPLLTAADLECVRGDNILFSGLNLELREGQLMQIEGANGSGKTSLLRIMAGLSRPAEGEVRWAGVDILRQRMAYSSQMAYLGHALGIKSDLSPLENLRISQALANVAFDEKAICRALEQTGLRGREDTAARFLSAGQRQRVAVARLLACSAKLWIMDEPFTALDAAGVSLVRGLLENHLERDGMVILTSHQVVEVSGEVLRVRLP